MKKRNISLFVFIAALSAGIGMYVGHKKTEPQTPEAMAVNHLFAQTMPDISGKQQPLAQWKGKPLIINFWATWCAPCVEEMPELAALQAEVAHYPGAQQTVIQGDDHGISSFAEHADAVLAFCGITATVAGTHGDGAGR